MCWRRELRAIIVRSVLLLLGAAVRMTVSRVIVSYHFTRLHAVLYVRCVRFDVPKGFGAKNLTLDQEVEWCAHRRADEAETFVIPVFICFCIHSNRLPFQLLHVSFLLALCSLAFLIIEPREPFPCPSSWPATVKRRRLLFAPTTKPSNMTLNMPKKPVYNTL